MLVLSSVAAIFIISAAVQGMTGIGFSLVVLALLIPLVGPLDGVTLIVINSAVTSLIVTIRSFRGIEWKHLVALSVPSVVVAFPVILLLNHVPEAVISLVVGGLLLSCTIGLVLNVKVRQLRGGYGPAAAGLVSGFLNATAGVAGPLLGVFSASVSWSHRIFVDTAQPFFIVSGLAVLGAKFMFQDTQSGFVVGGDIALVAVAGCMLGLLLGSKLINKMSEATGHKLVIGVSAMGATGTLIGAAIQLV
ncbi:hypothetical protein SAMN04489752_1818 [Brevibacterium siliguriense]|uniref:Probable membrane transporter protein n=1 Tax=Brevibacterium siliguriense TaxID=1136497 RepID=A0A1H1SLC1_9MICO|nr:sulfite exporter TauE/SafE family protein [Brevibacterium siliguriense]SDS48648.1 hypothetical protein SAMN04489752_1818 [Brevibacterium siliguriense]